MQLKEFLAGPSTAGQIPPDAHKGPSKRDTVDEICGSKGAA